MAKPISEVIELEYASANALPGLFPPKENLRYIVTEKNQVTANIQKIRVRSLGSIMKFWPGQHIMLGDEGIGIPMRPYSIVNTPNPGGEIVLYVTKK